MTYISKINRPIDGIEVGTRLYPFFLWIDKAEKEEAENEGLIPLTKNMDGTGDYIWLHEGQVEKKEEIITRESHGGYSIGESPF